MANASREQYQALIKSIHEQPLKLAKQHISSSFQNFVANHVAIEIDGKTSSTPYPKDKIALAKHQIELTLDSAKNRATVRMALESCLDQLGVPTKLVGKSLLLYPDIPANLSTKKSINKQKEAQKKNKKKRKKRKKTSKSILQLIAERCTAHLKAKVVSPEKDSALELSLTPVGDTRFIQITKSDKLYQIRANGIILSLHQSGQISKANFAHLLTQRTKLALDAPALATHLESLKALLRQDEEVVRLYESPIELNSINQLEFKTKDKRQFQIITRQQQSRIEHQIKLTTHAKEVYQISVTSQLTGLDINPLSASPSFLISLLASPLFTIACQFTSQLNLKDYAYQPFFFIHQTHFDNRINLAIVTPDQQTQTVSLIKQGEHVVFYFSPHPESRPNPGLPRFLLDSNGVQSAGHQAATLLETQADKVTQLHGLQQQVLHSILEYEPNTHINLDTLIEQHLSTTQSIHRYSKLLAVCDNLYPEKANWATDKLEAINALFALQLSEFIKQHLQSEPEGSDRYLKKLIALPSRIARLTDQHKDAFLCRKAIYKELKALRQLQNEKLALLLPTHLLEKRELLSDEEIAHIRKSNQRLSNLLKPASRGLKAQLKQLMQQLTDKAAETQKLLQEPFCELNKTTSLIHKIITAADLRHIKHASAHTLVMLCTLAKIAVKHRASLYLSGTAALHLAGLLPAPEILHSDLDIWLITTGDKLQQAREEVNNICSEAMPIYPRYGTKQFNYTEPGRTRLEVITAAGSLEAVLERGTCTSHNALANLVFQDDQLVLQSITHYVANNQATPRFFHMDQATFKPTRFQLRHRLRIFLFACKIACKYGLDPLSQAVLVNLSTALSREPAHSNGLMQTHIKRCHPYVKKFLLFRYPDIARRARLEQTPHGSK